ncbi:MULTISPECIES: tetratricopeptide repeat protein [Clostridium]|uniref:Tetratricopeptide repeat protein n=1 Tax=Clostridium frigoriphilum TaxID=443253 RepID=A0ABU7UWU3_9CLOT|nr:tetratricopeptide repeat protein [Clostridium sp. DSM 17811]MBU3102244.1 tetratricopeptide repeat protein [Clostridium sp. DSM 17811]
MIEERIIAKKLRKEGNLKEAVVIYKKLWGSCNKGNVDVWLGWEYADTLKKLNMLDNAISVCKQIYLSKKGFKYNNDLLSWCLYQKFFKNLDTKEKELNLGQIESIARFIINNTQQDIKLPYEKTVWKIIKLFKELFKEPFDARKIGLWLDKLNVDLLKSNGIT